MSKTAKLRALRAGPPTAPPMNMNANHNINNNNNNNFLDDQGYGEPGNYEGREEGGYEQDEGPSRFSGGLMYLLFVGIPFLIIGAVLYFWNPTLIQLDDGSVDLTKVILGATLAGIAGFLVKFFLFKDN